MKKESPANPAKERNVILNNNIIQATLEIHPNFFGRPTLECETYETVSGEYSLFFN